MLVFGQSGDAHCDFTVTDRAKLPEALKCIGEGGAPLEPLKAFTKKDLKKLWDPLRDHADEIAALDKTSVVFAVHDGRGALRRPRSLVCQSTLRSLRPCIA